MFKDVRSRIYLFSDCNLVYIYKYLYKCLDYFKSCATTGVVYESKDHLKFIKAQHKVNTNGTLGIFHIKLTEN